MPRITYPPEYRQRILELARIGRSVSSLARKFESAERTIRERGRHAELEETGAARSRREGPADSGTPP